jgi:hypothetical protein
MVGAKEVVRVVVAVEGQGEVRNRSRRVSRHALQANLVGAAA